MNRFALGHRIRAGSVAALIAEPAYGLLHITRGNPCSNPFSTYRL